MITEAKQESEHPPPGIVLCGPARSFVSSGSGWMLVIETAWHLRDGALHVGFFLPSLG